MNDSDLRTVGRSQAADPDRGEVLPHGVEATHDSSRLRDQPQLVLFASLLLRDGLTPGSLLHYCMDECFLPINAERHQLILRPPE